ncbi:DUF3105 domain-containing protein [Rubrobacter marinus]|uniref:DUF3105 domain-containing protein n=1 Tax=Rubrobacter marinus TaxID=2653852 RepID=A0A6G8Q003_9ACTN|nr:DUF3105 domain-containing protein [Rubrobacter marinus]QIN79786.1 DUF3105 domain-containing protein [Rubrobacter marinus]
MGKSRGAQGQQATGGGPSRTTIIIGLVVLAFLGGFGALVWLDSSQSSGPPDGVEEFDVSAGAGNHTQDPVDYEQSPPVGGAHNDVWQNATFYEEPIRNENAVHTLEHGAVWITYSPDLPQEGKDRIRELVEGRDCLMASPYPDLPGGTPIVASAWGKQLAFESADDEALQQFIQAYRRGPQTPEPGAACTGGTAETV